MRFTEARHRGFGHWVVVLALIVAGATLILPETVDAGAYGDASGGGQTITDVAPQQQGGGEPEGDSELPWLFAVFFITWAVFFTYVFFMSRRQREMQREIEALKRALAETEPEVSRTGEGR